MTTLLVSVSDEQKSMLEGLFQQLHIPFEELSKTSASAESAQRLLDPVLLRTIIDYGIDEPESEVRPYAHITDVAEYARKHRNVEWE